MRISQRLQSIAPSSTLAVAKRLTALQRQGIDVVNFGVGEPDFDTPLHIKEAAAEAIATGSASKYTPVAGIPELRQAAAEELSRVHGVPLAAEQVLISTGAKHSLWNVMMALLDEGDEVIVPTPTWPSHIELVRMAGGVPRLLPMRAVDGFQLDLERLAGLLGPRTRAILLGSPSNPTGAVLNERTLHGLAELIRRQRNPELYVITDDLYRQLVYPPAEWRSLLRVAPDLAGQIIPVDGVSKAYAMTGWRIGFCAAPVELVEAMERLQGQVITNPTAVAQLAALAALRGDQGPVAAMRSEFDQRRRFMFAALTDIPGVKLLEPQGAFYCLPDLSAYLRPPSRHDGALPTNDVELADWLLHNASVGVVPGAGFMADGFLRFSYATALPRIEEGLRRVAQALAQLRAA